MSRLVAPVVLVLALAGPAQADPIVFSDNFEAPTINPFWSPFVQSGSISFVSSPVHGGSQSVQFNSTNTGQNKYILLNHAFASATYGTASVWVFDTGADVFSSNYLTLGLQNQALGTQAIIVAYDYDLGPGQSGSEYYVGPGGVGSGVDRTRGWHHFQIETTPDATRYFIDGSLVYTDAPFAFDHLNIGMFGPSWRPAWQGQFDDFSFQEFAAQTTPAPEPTSLLVFAGLLVVGVGVARRTRATP